MDSKKIITMTIVSLIILIAITAVNGSSNQEELEKEEQKRISDAVRDSTGYKYKELFGKVWGMENRQPQGVLPPIMHCKHCKAENYKNHQKCKNCKKSLHNIMPDP
ncbi:uncharacterized protein LOC126839592 isoform X2 [Adelges cooleyi]|uniref:uncharacterized protein LOC126839592 isoform X2 n=1 Tax=Adelges cooleyi TaxID=133065 RepID=UPI00217F5F0D|nr:uncharacterized protein LOC126839592 isoform X2 [Adelges cooleyi]